MKNIKFNGCNTTFAVDQPEYKPLIAFKDSDGVVVSCYKLSLMERLRVLFLGRLWLGLITFNNPLQPQRLSTKRSDLLVDN